MTGPRSYPAVTRAAPAQLSRSRCNQPRLSAGGSRSSSHRILFDELVGAPDGGDPRIRLKPERRNGRIVLPLPRKPRGMHAWRVVISPERGDLELRTHDGYEWLYVLSGEMRLILAGHDVTMKLGEVAEFYTSLPHWFGPVGDRPVEILNVLRREGEHMHVRAVPSRKSSG